MKKLLNLFLLLFIAVALPACGPDEPDDPNTGSGQTGGSSEEDDPIARTVMNNISATVYYSEYAWNISIKSNLADKFPGKSIIYGTECGYERYDYYKHFSFKTEYLEKSDRNGNMEIKFPLFVGNEYPNEGLYYSSYAELRYKQSKGEVLDSDERDLLNTIIKELNKAEGTAKSKYCGRLYVLIDSKKYFYRTYGQQPTNNGGDNSGSGGSSNGGGGGSDNSYEKPEISFVDFTNTTTSITAKFRIDNQSKAKVTSVKGYYGKSSAASSASASLSGSLITVRVSGLSKGTTYYVKCSATGPAGTTTSGQIKLSTQY